MRFDRFRRLSAQWTLAAIAIVPLVLSACAGESRRPHHGIERLWREFVSIPPERALALAGDPDGVWVAGAAGGAESRREAEADALAECAAKRAARRMQMPCLLYATGDKIVWPGWL